jgi:2-dehydro-3-deoxy-L-rhamnonate dehydrogenase (NAD+)
VNQIDLNGRVAIVTGGAQGIGRASAERMLASGAAVALWDLDGDQLSRTVAELSARGTVSGQVVELTDEA